MTWLKASTQLWLAAWEELQERSDELFRLLSHGCKHLELDSVHDLRVSSRRVREGLTLFAPCFPKRYLTPLRSRLKRLTNILGTIRNTDEALCFFAPLAEELSGPPSIAAGQLLLALQSQREGEQQALKKDLKAISPTKLRVLFDHLCNRPIIFNATEVDPLQPVADFLRDSIAERELPLHELYPQACLPENIEAQHRLRIAVKRFRYRMEFFSSLATPGYVELYAQTKSFHDVLGRLHDLDVFSSLVIDKVSDPRAQQSMQDLIAQRRQELFAEFLRLDAICPVTTLGERLRRLL